MHAQHDWKAQLFLWKLIPRKTRLEGTLSIFLGDINVASEAHSTQKTNNTAKTHKTTKHTQNQCELMVYMEGGLKPHYSSLKPFLTEQNKYSQLLYALEVINPSNTTKSRDKYDYIHVDEKWFYLSHDR